MNAKRALNQSGREDPKLRVIQGFIQEEETVDEVRVLRIPIAWIRHYANQPRQYFDPVTMDWLKNSIEQEGQLAAGQVIKLEPPDGEYRYELIDGERRLRACKMAGVSYFRASIETGVMTESRQFERAAIANFFKEDHPPLEVANMIKRFKSPEFNYTREQIAKKLGRSVTYVDQHALLLLLHPAVVKYLDPTLPEDKQMEVSIARKLAKFSPSWQAKLAIDVMGDGGKAKVCPAVARHLISKAMHVPGAYRDPLRPDKTFDMISSFLNRTRDQIVLFNEAADLHLHKTLAVRPLQERMKISENLARLVQEAESLKKKVDKILAEKEAPKGED